MSEAVAKYFEIRDACAAAGGVLTDMAKAMDDAVGAGVPLEQAIGCFGRWRVEARQVVARRYADRTATQGSCSARARDLRRSLLRYAATAYERDKVGGETPEGANGLLFRILAASAGRVPATRTLRRRFS
jgi:hypothetical protein